VGNLLLPPLICQKKEIFLHLFIFFQVFTFRCGGGVFHGLAAYKLGKQKGGTGRNRDEAR
jgi:hypothetical protein